MTSTAAPTAAVTMEQVRQLNQQIYELKEQLARLRHELPPEEVEDYTFAGPAGQTLRLSELFGDQNDLILVHNMGKSCPYCTLWADGFNSLVPHLESRAAFVVISPDDPETQQRFAAERGWRFKLYSGQGSNFIGDMGYHTAEGFMPGVSTFRKHQDGRITRVATTEFGPGDDFCSVWHFFDLLAEGVGGWEPKYKY